MKVVDEKTLITLLKFGIDHKSSDMHFEVGGPPRYRVKGDLLKARGDFTLTPDAMQKIAKIILKDRELDLNNFFPEQDTSYSAPGISRFRVSIFRQRGSIGCIFRSIPFEVRGVEELNLPTVINDIADARRGLILVTGATGNGKSTTVASMIKRINESHQAHIITIEDPIEFLFEDDRSMIIQREVGIDTGSFREAMAAALRMDPDVIMLGEIRDAETAQICLKAAETGHLVISTLHTPDVTSTIKRFCGFFDASTARADLGRFAECLHSVISLRLLKTSDGAGLIPAAEIMRVTHTLQECMRNEDKHGEILQHMATGRDMYGMQTFDQHLAVLVQEKKVAMDEAKLHASKPDELERAMMVE
jgi:twitching motility protein PilT